MNGNNVIAATKTHTTEDVTSGIVSALRQLHEAASFEPGKVTAVMIGTTHFINALVEGKKLTPTAAIRFGLPATRVVPPLVDWPNRLVDVLGGHSYLSARHHLYRRTRCAPR